MLERRLNQLKQQLERARGEAAFGERPRPGWCYYHG
jgi:hypothetical protein